MIIDEKAMNPNEAGEFLHTLLPERTAQQWLNWLGNNRDPERDAVVRVPYSRKGRSRIVYSGDDLMEAATVLAVKTNVRRNRIGSTGVQVAPAEKILANLTVEDIGVRAEPVTVLEPVVAPVVVSYRPGLELALKVLRDLPPGVGVTAEQALLIMLNTVPQ